MKKQLLLLALVAITGVQAGGLLGENGGGIQSKESIKAMAERALNNANLPSNNANAGDWKQAVHFEDLNNEQIEQLDTSTMTDIEAKVLKSANHAMQAVVRCAMDIKKYLDSYKGMLADDAAGESKNKAAPITFFAGTRYKRLYDNMVKKVQEAKVPKKFKHEDEATLKSMRDAAVKFTRKRKFYVKKLLMALVAYDRARRSNFFRVKKDAGKGLYADGNGKGDDGMAPLFKQLAEWGSGYPEAPNEAPVAAVTRLMGADWLQHTGLVEFHRVEGDVEKYTRRWGRLSQGAQAVIKPVIQAIIDLALAIDFPVPRFSENSRVNRKLFMMAVGSLGLLSGFSVAGWQVKNFKRSMTDGIHRSAGLMTTNDRGKTYGGISGIITGGKDVPSDERREALGNAGKALGWGLLLGA